MSVNIALVIDPEVNYPSDIQRRITIDGVSVFTARCRDAESFQQWVADSSLHIDGILFTNESLYRTLNELELIPVGKCAVVHPSSGDLLRTLMQRAGGVYSGDLSRVMIDIGDASEVLNDILTTQFRPMIVSREIWRAAPGESFEDSLLRRYRVAWDCSSIDLILTDQSELLEPLRKSNINVWYLPPSLETIRNAAQKMALSILEEREKDFSPVFAILGTRSGQIAFEHLREVLEVYNNSRGRPFLIMRRAGAIELSSYGFSRKELINGKVILDFYSHMEKGMGEPVVVGWGIGVSVPHARDCAAKAYREALFDIDSNSYLVDEKNDLYGPFKIEQEQTANRENYTYLRAAAKKAGVSSATLAKILQAVDRIGREDVTSEKLSHALGITQRSASRLLSNLTLHGAAKLCDETSDALRGRPAKRYNILL